MLDAGAAESGPDSGAKLVRVAIDDPLWTSFAESHAAATPFHDPAWARLLASVYRYEAFAFVVLDEDRRVVQGAPFIEVRDLRARRRWVSLPFTDECVPLTGQAAAADDSLSAALACARGRRATPPIEIRGAVGSASWTTNSDAVIHALDLDADPERVHARFARSQVVRNIRRSLREGVSVRAASSAADVDVFYGLHVRTRKRQGVPVQPRRLFDEIWARLIVPGKGSLLLADGGGRTIAGALFLNWNGTTIYKFGASDREYWPLRPNHLLFWTAIRESCERGDHRFDFGRTDLANRGLRAFKQGWGAVERPLVTSTLGPTSDGGHLAERLAGSAIRLGPSWVCRGLGHALYRYAGSR